MSKTICLNMIVKNESRNIIRCLESLWDQIDYWVICDTGSTDNTKDLIRDFFKQKNIKGELLEHEWVNFSHNRNLALNAAKNKCDYMLLCDADMKLSIQNNIKLGSLLEDNIDTFYIKQGNDNFRYNNVRIINGKKDYLYHCPTHEYISASFENEKISYLNDCDVFLYDYYDGGSRSEKFQRDAELLENALKDDPDNSRYVFYLAQSYKDMGNIQKAVLNYEKVLNLNGWLQEKYYSCLMLGELYKLESNEKSTKYYIKASEYDSRRIEGVVRACENFLQDENHYMICNLHETFKDYKSKKSSDFLFCMEEKYRGLLEYYYTISSFYTGKKKEGYSVMKTLLFEDVLDDLFCESLIKNFTHYTDLLEKDEDNEKVFDALNRKVEYFLKQNNDPNLLNAWNVILDSCLEKTKLNSFQIKNKPNPDIFLSITSCKRIDLFKKTINSFLNHCLDIDRVDYWFCVDDNSSQDDRKEMLDSYPFFDYVLKDELDKGHKSSMNIIWEKLKELKPKYWIHLEDDFLFYVKDNYVQKSIECLQKYPDLNVKQVLFNLNYSENPSHSSVKGEIKLDDEFSLHEYKEGQYPYSNCHYWPHYSFRPSMIDVDSVIKTGNYDSVNNFFERDYADKWYKNGFKSAFFNKITSFHMGRSSESGKGMNSYELNSETQFNSCVFPFL